LLSFEGPAPAHCTDSCDGLMLHAAGDLPPHPEFETFDWWSANGHEAGVDPITGERLQTISGDSINTPVWIIEEARTITPAESGEPDLQVWYRILVRGAGHAETAVSVVESIIVRSWPEAGTSAVVAGACPGSSPGAICGRFAWRELL